ncbi:MAG: site-specific DNA-methyltransferase [Chthoniobacterales bacterium]
MPTLDFKGKSFVYTHHLGVPYRELIVVPEKSCPLPGKKPGLDDNLILRGDNLEGLKALLPRYAGKVDCIFIDPPYNTGEEGWCYNDRVNSPLMREWIKSSGNPVDKEDLQRHDKWLCMMWPRLQLLKELLSDNGSIWITLDDNEIHYARAIIEEIFGEYSFVGQLVWQKRTSRENRAALSSAHDHLLLFAKSGSDNWKTLRNLLEPSDEGFSNPDSDPKGDWRSIPFSAQGFRANQVYDITTPTGKVVSPPRGRCWGATEAVYLQLKNENRVYFPKDGDGKPRIKQYRGEEKGLVPMSIWFANEVGDTESSKREILQIFHEQIPFDTPKPVRLIQRIVEISTKPDSLILDSFAGSGTTAQAVLAQNKRDGGKRRFVLCEMEDYADTLTAERVRRVINGYEFEGVVETELCAQENVTWTTFSKDSKRQTILDRIEGIENLERGNYDKIEKKITDGVLTVVGQNQVTEKVPGLGGSFTFVELGEPMDLDRLLSENPGELPSFESLARYLFFTVTGQTLEESPGHVGAKAKKGKAVEPDGPVLIGETANLRVYLDYKASEEWLRSPAAAFTRLQAEEIANKRDKEAPGKNVLVIAASKYVSHQTLQQLRVDFAQLPYALHRIQAG